MIVKNALQPSFMKIHKQDHYKKASKLMLWNWRMPESRQLFKLKYIYNLFRPCNQSRKKDLTVVCAENLMTIILSILKQKTILKFQMKASSLRGWGKLRSFTWTEKRGESKSRRSRCWTQLEEYPIDISYYKDI